MTQQRLAIVFPVSWEVIPFGPSVRDSLAGAATEVLAMIDDWRALMVAVLPGPEGRVAGIASVRVLGEAAAAETEGGLISEESVDLHLRGRAVSRRVSRFDDGLTSVVYRQPSDPGVVVEVAFTIPTPTGEGDLEAILERADEIAGSVRLLKD